MEGIAGEFSKRLLAGCDSERRVSVAGHAWRVEQRVRTDDFSADTTSIDDFAPNGTSCLIYCYISECLGRHSDSVGTTQSDA